MEFESWGLLKSMASSTLEPINRYVASRVVGPFASECGGAAIHGMGRSYSDVALPVNGGAVISTKSLNHVIRYDRVAGLIEVESGMTLRAIQDLVLEDGWGLSVLPGTLWASVGGSIANDVHGKNHHIAGAFSRSVKSLKLLRTDDGIVDVSRESGLLWKATIGGLGATGLIVSAVLILVRWPGRHVKFSQQRFVGINDFMKKAERGGEYTVAWIDAFSEPARGVLFSGTVVDSSRIAREVGYFNKLKSLKAPLIPAINSPASRAFNLAYWISHPDKEDCFSSWEKFFCPLDELNGWNRLYGKAGFSQFQCVVPFAAAEAACDEMFAACRAEGLGSFLAVVKTFGSVASEGVLSFPREGVTFAMDFPNGERTRSLLRHLNAIAMSAGGALYPAKVCFDSMANFEGSFPEWRNWRSCWDAGGLGANNMWIRKLKELGGV